MARGKGQGRGGLIAAYLLVLTLIGASAAFVFGSKARRRASPSRGSGGGLGSAPRCGISRRAAQAGAGQADAAAQFRGFAGAELADMVEVTDEGQRLPRVSPSGWMPWIAYARRFDPAGRPPASAC